MADETTSDVPVVPEPEAPKKSRAELELERLQKAVEEIQAQVDAEAKLAETYGLGAKDIAYHLHDSFCDLCCNNQMGGCAVHIARLSNNANWTDEYHQYWLKAAAKVADFLTSKGWEKP